MILMIVALLLVLYVFFFMCLLVVGKRANHEMELLFIDSLDDLQEVHTYSPRTRSESHTWVSLHHAHSAEPTIDEMSSSC